MKFLYLCRCFMTIFVTLWVLLTAFGCSNVTMSSRNSRHVAELSMQEVRQVGFQTFPAVIQLLGGEFSDLQVQGYVQELGRKISHASGWPDQEFQFRVVTSAAPELVAIPGGFVVISRGLLDFVQSEDQLAMLISHAIAHVTLGHAGQSVSRQHLGNLLNTLREQGDNAPRWERGLYAGVLAADFREETFTLQQEREAARVAMDTLVAAGFDPNGAVETLAHRSDRNVSAEETDGLVDFVGKHPGYSDRPEKGRESIQEHYPAPDSRPVSPTQAFGFDALQLTLYRSSLGYQLYRQARVQEVSEDQNLAIETLHEALKAAPDESFILCEIGLAYVRQEDLLTARRYFRQAIALESDYYQSHLGLGYIYFQRNEPEHAIRELKRSNELLATSQGVFLLAEALSGGGRMDEAAELYRAVVSADPESKLGKVARSRLEKKGAK